MKTLSKHKEVEFDLIVKDILHLDPDDILRPEQKIVDDLGCDSLDFIEIVITIEKQFDIRINDDEAEKVITIQDAYNLIANLL